MNTKAISSPCVALGLAIFISPSAALSQQPMNDTSSVYNDMWFDDTTVWVTGQITGSIGVHTYATYLTLHTPSGTNMSSQPGFAYGTVYNNLNAPWTAADLGADFTGTAQNVGYCTVGTVYFTLAYVQLKRRPISPNYQCTQGLTNVCADASNGLAPLGPRVAVSCKKWNYCCAADNSYYSGWCRIETCQKVAGQAQNPVSSQCMSQSTCQNYTINAFCPSQ